MNRIDTDFVESILAAVEQIPPGQVLTYGDVAEFAGFGAGHARAVGSVMAHYGSSVAWWRVLRAGGLPPTGHEEEALVQYRAEGTALRPTGDRVDLSRARWSGQ